MIDLGVYRDRFAKSGLRVFEQAIEEAKNRGQNYLSFGHLFKALQAEIPVLFDEIFANLKLEPPLTVSLLDKIIADSPHHEGKGLRISPDVIWLFKQAMKVARARGSERIEASDLISALTQSLLVGAPWLAERGEDRKAGLSFKTANQPYFYLVRL